MSCGFITAAQARELSQPTALLYQEVCAIQQAVLAASDSQQFATQWPAFALSDDPTLYADVFLGQSDDAVIISNTQFVIDYFSALGYNIRPAIDVSTGDTLVWHIRW